MLLDIFDEKLHPLSVRLCWFIVFTSCTGCEICLRLTLLILGRIDFCNVSVIFLDPSYSISLFVFLPSSLVFPPSRNQRCRWTTTTATQSRSRSTALSGPCSAPLSSPPSAPSSHWWDCFNLIHPPVTLKRLNQNAASLVGNKTEAKQ